MPRIPRSLLPAPTRQDGRRRAGPADLRRRDLLGLAAAGLAAPALLGSPRALAAPMAVDPGDRKFLFVFCDGGWDTTVVFTPEFDNPEVQLEPDAVLAESGGLRWVSHESRPSVDAFFADHAPRTALVHGLEVRSVTHELCRQILLTGTTRKDADDFPSTLAALAPSPLDLPHLVVHGRAFTSDHSASVVRVGSDGQLPDLLDGTALRDVGVQLDRISTDGDALAEAWVQQRLQEVAATGGTHGADFAQGYLQSLEILDGVRERAGSLDLAPGQGDCARDTVADCQTVLDCFELGLSRCGMVQFDGWCSLGFDTHAQNFKQAEHFELLFAALREVVADLDTRVSHTGRALRDEVTIVVVSEMGRTPQENSSGGRDHWTFTSAMLLGSGVQGGQVVGGMDEGFRGRPVDLSTGELRSDGVRLLPGHLGATLYAMAGLDGEALSPDGEAPIEALIDT